jgi:O-antigen/teichoic acid export membrane protein
VSKVIANSVANFLGSAWSALISLIFIPVYIGYLGIEAYGLIGLSVTITTILSLADFGLAAAVTREMARDWGSDYSIAEGRRVLTVVSRLYFALAMILGALVVALAPYVATEWVNPARLSGGVVTGALRAVGVVAGLQLLSVFFSAALMGLQRQVLTNAIAMIGTGVHALGAVLILEFYRADIVVFFYWQALTTAATAAVLALAVNSIVPRAPETKAPSRPVLRRLMPFALGMSGISLLSIVLTQTDKFVLSALLSLEEFGYYSLAALVALSLRRLFGPLFAAVYPRLIEFVRRGEAEQLARLYHLASQAMAVVVLPASLALVLYAREVVYVWTGDLATAERTQTMIALLVAGTALTGLTQTPYALQLAHGWTRLALKVNVVSAGVFVPAVYVLGGRYGGEGAALAWLGLNLVYFFIQVPLMHRRILAAEQASWYWRDTLLPGAAASVPLLLAYPLSPHVEEGRLKILVFLAVAAAVSLAAAFIAAGELRRELTRRIAARRSTA